LPESRPPTPRRQTRSPTDGTSSPLTSWATGDACGRSSVRTNRARASSKYQPNCLKDQQHRSRRFTFRQANGGKSLSLKESNAQPNPIPLTSRPIGKGISSPMAFLKVDRIVSPFTPWPLSSHELLEEPLRSHKFRSSAAQGLWLVRMALQPISFRVSSLRSQTSLEPRRRHKSPDVRLGLERIHAFPLARRGGTRRAQAIGRAPPCGGPL